MEILVPLMPLFATLPFAVAAVWIAHRVLKYRERGAALKDELAELEQKVEALRHAQAEVQERLDFTERVLTQLRGAPRAKQLE